MLCFGNDAPCLYLTTISSMANFLSTLLYSEFIFSSPKVNGARVSAMFPCYGCTSQSFVWDWHSLPIDASTNHTTHKPIVPYLINGIPFVYHARISHHCRKVHCDGSDGMLSANGVVDCCMDDFSIVRSAETVDTLLGLFPRPMTGSVYLDFS